MKSIHFKSELVVNTAALLSSIGIKKYIFALLLLSSNAAYSQRNLCSGSFEECPPAPDNKSYKVTKNITLLPGTYSAYLIICADGITVDGNGSTLILTGGIEIEGRSHITIKNFNFNNSANVWVYPSSSYCTFEKNSFSSSGLHIVDGSHYITIQRNNFLPQSSLSLRGSHHTVRDNSFGSPSGIITGIYTIGTDITIENNIFVIDTDEAASSTGIWVSTGSRRNIVRGNTLLTSDPNRGLGSTGISIDGSNHNVHGNKLKGQDVGIFVTGDSNYVVSNEIQGYPPAAKAGIHIVGDYNIVTSNYIYDVHAPGILLFPVIGFHPNHTIIAYNTLQNNDIGIKDNSAPIDDKSYSKIYYNNFIDNIVQGVDVVSPLHFWDRDSLCGGNYWSDFDIQSEGCIDINADGICDTARTQNGGPPVDRYPFVRKDGWENRPKDASCSLPPEIEIVDAIAFVRLGTTSITTYYQSLMSPYATVVDGVAADGTAKLVIRVKTNISSEVPVTFSLDPSDGAIGTTGNVDEDGSLSTIEAQTTTSNKVTAQSVKLLEGQVAFAIYNAPVDFVRNSTDDATKASREITLVIKINGTSYESRIKIVRPPVFLIHGLWSNPTIWDNFPPLGTPSGSSDPLFDVFRADYLRTNNKHISVIVGNRATGVLKQLRNVISEYKKRKNVAAAKADVIAHSLGGLVSRAMSYYQPDYYFEETTFGEGRIHKLITIDTPHRGSEFADLLIRALMRAGNSVLDALRFATLQEGFKIREDFRGRYFSAEPISGGAVDDLRTTSPIIGILNEPARIDIQPPIHTFVCTSSPLQVLANESLTIMLQTYLGETPSGYNGVFGSQEHDLLVADYSQRGPFGGTQLRITRRTELTHSADFLLAKSVISQQSGNPSIVINLLNAPRNSEFFSPNGRLFAPQYTSMDFVQRPMIKGYQNEPITTANFLNPGIRFTSPTSGTTINTGSTVNVVVEANPGFSMNKIFLIAVGAIQEDSNSPFTFSVTIPDDVPLGTAQFMAIGVDAAGNFAVDADTNALSAKISLNISTPASLDSIRVGYDTTLEIPLGVQRQPIYVTGFFSDGIARNITQFVGTSYTSSDPSVAIVDSGIVKALAIGKAIVTVSNSGHSHSIELIVEPTNLPPIANAGPDQTVKVGTVVQLNGSSSFDPEGDSITFHWQLVFKPQKSDAVLSNSTDINPTFNADSVGYYLVQLNVLDQMGRYDSSFVSILAKTVTSITEGNTQQNLPTIFTLHQNYPNPFNPITIIKFDLPKQSLVTLKIYNVVGQEVKVLVNNKLYKAGWHTESFLASELASGIYFYRIVATSVEANGTTFRNVKKMLLLK